MELSRSCKREIASDETATNDPKAKGCRSGLSLHASKADEAHVIVLRRLAQKLANVLDDRGAGDARTGAKLSYLISQAIDRVERPTRVDRFVDTVGKQRECVAELNFDLTLLVTECVSHA